MAESVTITRQRSLTADAVTAAGEFGLSEPFYAPGSPYYGALDEAYSLPPGFDQEISPGLGRVLGAFPAAGALSPAFRVLADAEGRWMSGISYEITAASGDIYGQSTECVADPVVTPNSSILIWDNDNPVPSLPAPPTPVSTYCTRRYAPFGLTALYESDTIIANPETISKKALTLLYTHLEYAIGYEFLTGAIYRTASPGVAPEEGNFYLQNTAGRIDLEDIPGTITGAGPAAVLEAQGLIEEYLPTIGVPVGMGVVHVPPRAIAMMDVVWDQKYSAHRTKLGNFVMPSGGYADMQNAKDHSVTPPTVSPSVDGYRMYGTGPVGVVVSSADDINETITSAIDRATNTIKFGVDIYVAFAVLGGNHLSVPLDPTVPYYSVPRP